MPRVTADEINTQKHVRFFYQPGGPGVNNGLKYGGQDGQYLNIESASNPRSGGINPINVQDPSRIGAYRRVGRSVDAPDFPTASVTFLQAKDQLPRHLTTLGDCLTNFYQVVGDCRDLSDFQNGWSSYIKVFSLGENTELEEAGGSFDSDEMLEDSLEYTFGSVYNIGKLGFGDKATTEVYSEVIDVVYGSRVRCQGCGPSDNGTSLMYAVANNTVASVGQAPSVFYSTDGGSSWTEVALTGSASTDVPRAIDIAGNYLVVLYDDGSTGGYFYAEINNITGAPGTWSQLTTGFVAGFAPSDMWVSSPREIWICGEGGYIYKVESISSGATVKDSANATAEDLKRIDGLDEIIVATAANGKVVLSTNRGETWATTDADPSANNLNALWVWDDFSWWVGDAAGNVYYSLDQGATWTEKVINSSGTAVYDIYFASPECGYIAYITAGPVAKLATTMNGGRDWTESSPRLNNWPVSDRANRLAAPEVGNLNVAVNNLLVGGLAGNGSDGLLLVATAPVK
jgi:photosystem II stability/assembly factor-like uncharacterized protein